MAENKKNTLAICIPGQEFSAQWVHYWSALLPRLMHEYDITLCAATSNNIYMVRNFCVQSLMQQKPDVDYVLWIDSDNLVTHTGVQMLMKEVSNGHSAVGGWYFVQSGTSGQVDVAGGWFRQNEAGLWYDERPSLDKLMGEDLIEVGYMGFGCLLMKGDILRDLGNVPFRPGMRPNGQILCDDESFCNLAREHGHKFYLHPKVHVPHLKLGAIGPQ